MRLFKVEDLAQQFVDIVNRVENSKDSDANKRADLSGHAKAYAFLFDLALNGVKVAEADTEKKED